MVAQGHCPAQCLTDGAGDIEAGTVRIAAAFSCPVGRRPGWRKKSCHRSGTFDDERLLFGDGIWLALEAIGMEPRVGAMLPCNVILREVTGGVEVSAVDPVASMRAIDNSALHGVAGQVRDMLAKAVAEI